MMCEKVHEKKEDPGSLVFISGSVTFLLKNFRGTLESELNITPDISIKAAVTLPQERNLV